MKSLTRLSVDGVSRDCRAADRLLAKVFGFLFDTTLFSAHPLSGMPAYVGPTNLRILPYPAYGSSEMPVGLVRDAAGFSELYLHLDQAA